MSAMNMLTRPVPSRPGLSGLYGPSRLCQGRASSMCRATRSGRPWRPAASATGSSPGPHWDGAFAEPAQTMAESEYPGAPAGNTSRRAALLAGTAALAAPLTLQACRPGPAHAAPELLEGGQAASKLFARATSADLSLLKNPGNSVWSKPGLTFYPRWMFGEWDVSGYTLQSSTTPLGPRFWEGVDRRAAAIAGGLAGPEAAFKQSWFSTLPPTLANELKVFLGTGIPTDEVVADRAGNARALINAASSYEACKSATYDPREAPDRLALEFERLGLDMRPLPPQKLEVFILNSTAEMVEPGLFVTSDLLRQVLLGVRTIDVVDYEVLTVYEQLAPGSVRQRRRLAVYLEPRDSLFFQAGGRAVAVFDSQADMRRMPPPEDAAAAGAQACVLTPKDVIQCI